MENMEMNQSFWKDKNVFLTGHTGFKGSWLSLWLSSLGARVTGFALNPETTPNLFDLVNVKKDITSVIGDIRDLSQVRKALDSANPDIVIHMAAQPIVRYSFENPVETYATNVMGTVHLLEAIRFSKNIRAVLNITSDKCYENQEWSWAYRENEPMGGYDPYSNSKGCAELVTLAFRSSYFNAEKYQEHGIALASARAGNVIGGGDWAKDRLIPDFMRSIVKGQKLIIRNPEAIRPWQHVLEPLSGYLNLAEKLYNKGPEFAEAWNFGPQDSETKNVEWIASELVKNWGNKASYEIEKNKNQAHEAHYLKLDSSKSRARLNWVTKWDINETISRICNWHKQHINNQDIRAYTLREINDYQSKTIS